MLLPVDCRQLRHLTLTNTELTVLPPVVCGLSRLELLRLNINQLQVSRPRRRASPILGLVERCQGTFYEVKALLAHHFSHPAKSLPLMPTTSHAQQRCPHFDLVSSGPCILPAAFCVMQTLPGGPYLRSLKTLDLSHNRFAAGYPAALAGATHLQLIAFQFRGTHYSDPVVALREAMAPQAAAAPAPAHAGPLAVAAAVVLPPELLPGEAMAMED